MVASQRVGDFNGWTKITDLVGINIIGSRIHVHILYIKLLIVLFNPEPVPFIEPKFGIFSGGKLEYRKSEL